MIKRCHTFEETLDGLKQIISNAPEFLELQGVEQRMAEIRLMLSDVKQLNAYRCVQVAREARFVAFDFNNLLRTLKAAIILLVSSLVSDKNLSL